MSGGKSWGPSWSAGGGSSSSSGKSWGPSWTGGAPAPAHKGGGLLGSIEKYSGAQLVGNLGKDVGNFAVGVLPGLYESGKTAVMPAVETVLHGPGSKQVKKADQAQRNMGRQVVKQYTGYYNRNVLSHLYQHPLQPILDALTVADLGSTAAVRLGLLDAGRASLLTRSPRAIAEGKGPVHTDVSATKPITKAREVAANRFRAAHPEGVGVGQARLGGEVKKYGAQIQAEANQHVLSRLAEFKPYADATKRLSEREWAALHIRAMDIHPTDLAQLWKGTPAAKWVNDPKVVALVENPSKRLVKAEAAAKDLSTAGQKILNEKGLLRTDTAEARPNLPRKQAAEVLGREPKGITGEPYYVPHTLEPQSAPNVLTAGGGGKAVPRAPGATKQNLGHLFLNGKMHLRSDVLGTEFLRRVKFVKYDEIHNALRRGAVRVTKAQLDEHYGGQLPKGYEYMRTKPVTFTKTETTSRAQTLNEASAELKRLEAEHNKALQDLAEARYGPVDQREQLYRNQENARARRQASGKTRGGKASGASGWKSKTRLNVREEQMRQLQNDVDKTIAAHPDLPVSKAWKARMDRIQELHDAVRVEWGDQPQLAGLPQVPGKTKTVKVRVGGHTIPATMRGESNISRPLDQLIPNPDDLHQSALAEGFTTTDQAQAVGHNKGVYYIVPKSTVKAATGEFTKTSPAVRMLVQKPLTFWRMAVLRLRPGFFTNNFVGNSIMYSVKIGGQGALRDLFGAIMDEHGPAVARQVLDSPATPPALRRSLYQEYFQDQMQGTFGRTQSPATSLVHMHGRRAAEATRDVTGALPKFTSAVAETLPRKALIRNTIRRSPEFKKAYTALPRQTRTFEAAARKVLDGEGGKAYQRFVSKQVNQALGDYMHLSPFERNVLRNAAPFYSWYRAIVTTTYHLAVDTPLRANILGHIGQLGKQWSDQQLGALPSFLEGAIPLGKSGPYQRALSTQGLNPYASLTQLEQGFGGNGSNLGINPFIQAAADAYAKAKNQYGGSGHINYAAVGLAALEAMAKALPPVQEAQPLPPSKLYPTRNRRSTTYSYFGVPIKTYDPAVAAADAAKGQ